MLVRFLADGPRPNAELLTSHGFALANNRHDAIPLSLEPNASDDTAAMKAKILAAGNITSPYALSPGALRTDSDLLVALRVIAATPTELQRYGDAFRGKPLSARNEHKWRKLLRERLRPVIDRAERLTTLEEDKKLLRLSRLPNATRHRGAGQSDRRRQTAIVCRLGEKQLLLEVLAELNSALDKGMQPEPTPAKAAYSDFKVA
jgi:hypothetical protein